MTTAPTAAFPPAGLSLSIVAAAEREFSRWNAGGRRTETDPRMAATLAAYWRGVGVSVTPAQLASKAFQAAHPWSAAFISWVMRQAGAGTAFSYSPAHAAYVAAAKRNRQSGSSNPFKAYRTTEVRPEPGDLICKSREGSGATYDNVRPGMKTHCDIVTAVAPGAVTVIGGNVADSVSRRTIPLAPDGRLASPEHFAVIKVGAAAAPPGPRPAPPSPGPAPRPAAAPAPSLIGRTYYAGIDLQIRDGSGNAVLPQTGIFCPIGWSPAQGLDLIVYFHGIRDPRTTVESYWDPRKNPHFALREVLAASGKNAVLVAPLLGPRSQNQLGSLGRAGGLDRFVASVINVLRQRRELSAEARVGNLILACHSGGGLAMRTVALAGNALAPSIRECWGFDCTYNRDDAEVWPRWAARNARSRLYLYYVQKTRTAIQALALQRKNAPNVAVIASRTPVHDRVPITHLPERLAASGLGTANRAGTRNG